MTRTTYPHMHSQAEASAAAAHVTVTAADAQGVTVATPDGTQTRMQWADLIAAANQPDNELGLVYLGIWKMARRLLLARPVREQGIRVIVTDGGTGGAMWHCEVRDATGDYRSDLMLVDDAEQNPNESTAQRHAAVIRRRLGI